MMFKRELKKNLKDKLMRDERELLNIKNLIEVLIKIDDKLYKKVIKKRFDQSYKRARTFFKSTIEYYASESYFKKYNNLNYREFALMKLNVT